MNSTNKLPRDGEIWTKEPCANQRCRIGWSLGVGTYKIDFSRKLDWGSIDAIECGCLHKTDIVIDYGEILKKVDDTYVGWVQTKHEVITVGWIIRDKMVFSSNLNFNLTQIKPKWYQDKNIIGKLVYDTINSELLEVEDIINGKIRCIGCPVLLNHDELRPATKDEVLSLYYENK
ncbi:MAG: hypothetical protein U9N34_10290 [Candidatus Cloacimonadota bacterium]|nr:hypothetical protein [Candidatus Cloacimonadota bacterium]